MSKVIFKKIRGYSDYSVSSKGEVISHKFGKEKVLVPSTTTGYKKVSLVNSEGVPNTFQVHRLVAQAFIKNPKKLPIVNHINGDKLDCKLSNLEWVTRGGNAEHYEKFIKPKNIKQKTEKANKEILGRLRLIDFAKNNFSDDNKLFQVVVNVALDGVKGL